MNIEMISTESYMLRERTENEQQDLIDFLIAAMGHVDHEPLYIIKDLTTRLDNMCKPDGLNRLHPYLSILLNRIPPDADCLYSSYTISYISSLCTNPAISVMWAHWMFHTTLKDGPITMTKFSFDYFKQGIPIEENYKNVWNNQKIKPEDWISGNDNLLDKKEAWLKSNSDYP